MSIAILKIFKFRSCEAVSACFQLYFGLIKIKKKLHYKAMLISVNYEIKEYSINAIYLLSTSRFS